MRHVLTKTLKMVNLPDPARILHRFDRHCSRNDVCKKFFVQEIMKHKFEDVIKFLERYYFNRSDPIIKAASDTDPDTVNKFKKFWADKILPQDVSLICLDRIGNQPIDRAKIVGVHLAQKRWAKKAERDIDNLNTTLPDLVMKIDRIVESKYDLHKTYYVDEYLKTVGICVRPDYDELNIVEGMLKASEEICRDNKLRLTTINATSLSLQTSAENTGYRSLVLTEVEEIENETNYTFPGNFREIRVLSKYVRLAVILFTRFNWLAIFWCLAIFAKVRTPHYTHPASTGIAISENHSVFY